MILASDSNNYCEICSGSDINNLVCGKCKNGSYLSVNTGICLISCAN